MITFTFRRENECFVQRKRLYTYYILMDTSHGIKYTVYGKHNYLSTLKQSLFPNQNCILIDPRVLACCRFVSAAEYVNL